MKKVKMNGSKITPKKNTTTGVSATANMPATRGQEKKGTPHMRRERIKIDLLIHDLKVPLAVIEAGLTSMMNRQEKYGPITEKQERVFKRALRNTKVLKALVGDALELGKSEEGIVFFSNFPLADLIEETLVEILDLTDTVMSEKLKKCENLMHLKKTLEEKDVILSIDETLWGQKIRQDETKIKQILRNLLSNALKYRKSRVELSVDCKEGFVVFSVQDDGAGIPASYHKKIFDCYFQLDATSTCSVRGHGLGLAGVMVLVEDLGGEMLLDSDEGQGAKFLVKIPLKTDT
ncbi:MAG: HAMP domain-containing histidine kinase [Deltaproteobacteria bacterium]|jgi:signal transduction histidine kinase|nr:HAMP domain-containing histidine kinase [Deltaproteobacteria bacterium]